jgi:chemotaxis protein histidine kinase CheA
MSTNPSAPTPSDAEAASAGTPTRTPNEPGAHRRPTGWIVLSCVLTVAAVGLGIWAISAQSDADEAQAKLASAAKAATSSTPEPTAAPTSASTPASVEVDPATQQQFEQVASDLGATSESVDQIEQDLDQAAAKADSAEQARDDATGAVDTAKAEAQAISARFELTQTCLRGTLSALSSAFESGGLEAAVQQLQKLSGNCASTASS